MTEKKQQKSQNLFDLTRKLKTEHFDRTTLRPTPEVIAKVKKLLKQKRNGEVKKTLLWFERIWLDATCHDDKFIPSVLDIADRSVVPEIIEKTFHGEWELCRLGRYCNTLANITKRQEIYISSKQLAEHWGTSPTQMWRWLMQLCHRGMLELIERGRKGKANSYRLKWLPEKRKRI